MGAYYQDSEHKSVNAPARPVDVRFTPKADMDDVGREARFVPNVEREARFL